MNDAVLEALGGLNVEALSLVRAELEHAAELSEGFPPISREWSRRLNVEAVRLAVRVAGYRVEFEIDGAQETLNVVALTADANQPRARATS